MSLTQVGQWGAGGTNSGSPWPSEDLRGPQKGLLEPKRAFLGAEEVLEGAQVHDMDASDPGALCGSVFDAIWPVSAVPGAQRGPKGAPKIKNIRMLAVLTPQTVPGAVVFKT